PSPHLYTFSPTTPPPPSRPCSPKKKSPPAPPPPPSKTPAPPPRHETVLPSTNTMRTYAKICSPSCKTSGSRPSNRQHFVDVDSPSALARTEALLLQHSSSCGASCRRIARGNLRRGR